MTADGGGEGRLGPFRTRSLLGRGSFGEVWEAVHEGSGERVAVKVLSPEHLGRWRRLVRRELEAAARLDHPGIVWVHDHGEDPVRGPWIALELASGGTLSEHPLPRDWSDTRTLLDEIAAALAHAHARDVLHRDLKPGNVLVCTTADPRPGPKLADFSLSTIGGAGRMRGGSRGWLAPEQLEAMGDEGPWTDLYALGTLVWALVCGAPPDAQPFAPRFPVPAGLEDWISWLRAPRAADRPPTVRAARDALDGLAPRSGTGAEPPPLSRPPAAARLHPRRSPASLGLFGLRTVPLVGRSDLQDAARAAVHAGEAGRGPTVIGWSGARGTGKSALLRWLRTWTREETRTVSVALDGDDGLEEALRVAWSTAERRARRTPGPALAAFLAGGDGLSEALAEVRAPTVLIVDDGGAEARTLLAAARDGGPGLTVVVAGRSVPAGVALPPLEDPGAVARALGVGDPALAHALGRRGGGWPGPVVDAVRALVRDGHLAAGPDGFVGVGDVAGTLRAQGSSAEPEGVDPAPLEVLALLGPAATGERWAGACRRAGIPRSEPEAEALRRAGLLDPEGDRLVDAALAEHLQDRLTQQGRRSALARHVAEELAAAPADPVRDERLGELWAAAGEPATAAPLLLAASTSARHLLDEGRAHALLDACEACLAELPGDAAADALRSRAALWRIALWTNFGHLGRAMAAADALRPSGAFEVWRHGLLRAQLWLRSGRPVLALDAARAALPDEPPACAGMTRAVIGSALLELGRPAEAVEELRGAAEEPRHRLELARALLDAGDADGAAALVAGDGPPDQRRTRALVALRAEALRGGAVLDRLDRLYRAAAGEPHLRADIATSRVAAAAVEAPHRLGALEAELRECLALVDTRSRSRAVILEAAAAACAAEVGTRLRDLAARQQPELG